MKHLKTYESLLATYKLFESKEDIEDCCLELFDLGLNIEIEEIKKNRGRHLVLGAHSQNKYIKLAGEILDKKQCGCYTGIYVNKIVKLEELKEVCFKTGERIRTPLNHFGKIVKGKPILNKILNTLPSVLHKLKVHVIGDVEIKFTVNAYGVARGTCIVILIEW